MQSGANSYPCGSTVQNQLGELLGKLAEAKLTMADLKEALLEKDEEIERLKKSFARKDELVEAHGFTYMRRADGTPKGRPVCPRCLEVDGLIIRIQATRGPMVSDSMCPQCKTPYHPRVYADD